VARVEGRACATGGYSDRQRMKVVLRILPKNSLDTGFLLHYLRIITKICGEHPNSQQGTAMARPASEHPTEMELQILKILWKKSPLLVREVRQALADAGRDIAHTSAITALNIMFKKKYLTRKKQGKSFLFAPRVGREQVCEGMLGDVVRRAFDGSATALMLSLFNCADLDEEELKELRRLINRKMNEQT